MTIQNAKDIIRTAYEHPQHKEAEELLIAEVERLKSELQKAEAACAEMRCVLRAWRDYNQADIPRTGEAMEQAGEQFTKIWTDMDKALSTNCGSALMARVAALEAALKALGKRRFDDRLCFCDTAAGIYCVGQEECKNAINALSGTAENAMVDELQRYRTENQQLREKLRTWTHPTGPREKHGAL